MSNENQGSEYIKVVADIIETELNLKPANPASVNPLDHRVIIWNQNFVLPTYNDMFIVLKEAPGKVMAAKTEYDGSGAASNEIQTLIMQREIDIDIMSRNAEARQRKEEVILALASVYSQQKQEANGFRIFSYAFSFIDASENEGAGRINRFRASLNLHVRYVKQKAIDYFNAFDYNVIEN